MTILEDTLVGFLGLLVFINALMVSRCLHMELLPISMMSFFLHGRVACLDARYHFCAMVVRMFGEEYLGKPNAQDIARLLSIGNARGFRGMLKCIDCIH
jgi:hypothetical protein